MNTGHLKTDAARARMNVAAELRVSNFPLQRVAQGVAIQRDAEALLV